MTPLPVAFSQMKISDEMIAKYWINEMMHPITKLMDYQMWLFLQLYFAPYRMATMGDDIDKVISSISLNGIKSFNLCQPKKSK
jgi:hypothetical protein